MADAKFEVAIIGAGPTGLTLALLLARADISCALVEKNTGPQRHPAACILNTRSLEIWRGLGVADEVMAHCQHVLERANITWVTTLTGRELGRCSVAPDNIDEVLGFSPYHTTHYPQNKLEPLLRRKVQESPQITFLPGHECTALQQSNEAVTCTLIDQAGEKSTLSAGYGVACDGAASAIRRGLGISYEGRVLQDMMGVYFTADLGQLVSHRASILYWVLNSEVLGVFIAHWLPDEWVLYLPYFPPQQSAADFTKEKCADLIAAAIGMTPHDLDIKLVRPWAVTAKRANSYRAGRMFLAGDAAHAFPPTGGFGLNTGVQDAHNLAWKLAAVMKRRAGPCLLDSYETERRPVAKTNLEHSVSNYEKTSDLLRVVGLDLRHLATLQAMQHSALFGILPTAWQKGIVNSALRLALGRLSVFDADSARARRARDEFKRRIPGQIPHYRFLGLDLGITYDEGAFIADGSQKPEAANPVTDYRPTTWPSARLPHFMVENDGSSISILDVLAHDGFTLLTRAEGAGPWRAAVAAAGQAMEMPLRCYHVGPGDGADLIDHGDAWAVLSETGPDGAVLIRPDGHVAWRTRSLPVAPAKELEAVMDQLLCLHSDPSDTRR